MTQPSIDGPLNAEPAAQPLALHPTAGELVDLRALDPDELGDALENVGDLYVLLGDWKAHVVAEVCRRADARGERTVTLGGTTFEVNAPTEDHYELGRLRSELATLVEAGVLDEAVLDTVIVQPPPKPVEAKVDRRRINALLKSDDRRLLAAFAAARRRSPTRRTAKVTARAVAATAEEL